MNVPLLDLRRQYCAVKPQIDAALAEVMTSQRFILGAAVERCEREIAAYCRCRHAVGVSSGTDALLVSLMAERIGPGDEVITTPYTFFATAGSIARVGATPVFVDIDPADYNLDCTALEAQVTSRTRAIIPVHLYGRMADMAAVMQVAARHGLVVIEDAAQAIGAERGGQRAGSAGHYGCFSFFPSKNLGAAGDGGMVVTRDPQRATAVARLRSHGAEPKYFHPVIGGNFRLDAVQAAIVSAKLPFLDAWTAARQHNAASYDRMFADCGLHVAHSDACPPGGLAAAGTAAPDLVLPQLPADRHVFNQYIIRVARRDVLRAALKERGVATEIYYPLPLHLQECFAHLGHRRGEFPASENAAAETLALPVHPDLDEAQLAHVVASVRAFFDGRAAS